MADTGTAAAIGRPPQRGRRGNPALRLTLLFMVVLLALGVVGFASLSLLRFQSHPLTQNDMVQSICTDYQTQQYDALVAQVDPSPIPPAVTGAFTDASKQALIGELRALDASDGQVTHCQVAQLSADPSVSADPTHAQYAYTMVRAHDPSRQFTLIMTLVRQPDGSWKIARNSNFLGTGP